MISDSFVHVIFGSGKPPAGHLILTPEPIDLFMTLCSSFLFKICAATGLSFSESFSSSLIDFFRFINFSGLFKYSLFCC